MNKSIEKMKSMFEFIANSGKQEPIKESLDGIKYQASRLGYIKAIKDIQMLVETRMLLKPKDAMNLNDILMELLNQV